MIKHIVFFKLKANTPGKTKAENLKTLIARLEILPAQIEVIQDYEVGANLIQNGDRFDLALYSVFEDQAALNLYRDHPAHQDVVRLINEITSERTAVDYET